MEILAEWKRERYMEAWRLCGGYGEKRCMYRMMRVEYKGQWKSRKREREKMRGFGLI